MHSVAAVAIGLAIAFGAGAADDLDARPRAAAIALDDVSARRVEVSFPRARPLVLMIADRVGSKQLAEWAKPIEARFGKSIERIGIANLQEVPTLMRGVVRKMTKNNPGTLLLDWDGEVFAMYAAKPKVANVIIVAPQGTIVSRYEGKADAGRLKELLETLEVMLDRLDAPVEPLKR